VDCAAGDATGAALPAATALGETFTSAPTVAGVVEDAAAADDGVVEDGALGNGLKKPASVLVCTGIFLAEDIPLFEGIIHDLF
jgi:hypothetical protein